MTQREEFAKALLPMGIDLSGFSLKENSENSIVNGVAQDYYDNGDLDDSAIVSSLWYVWKQAAKAQAVPESALPVLLWILAKHQGGKSDVGQPIRKLLGIGQFDDLTKEQFSTAMEYGKMINKPVVPEGWKLVPVEPTPEMIDAYIDSEIDLDPEENVKSGWKAMLLISPDVY